MLRWCSRHPIWFMAGYLMLYLAVFRWQELHLTPVVWVHTPLDDLIPFCEYAILPYLAWFVWIPFTLFALLRGPRTDFMRLCLPLFAGMTAALTCYMLLPTGLALRPPMVQGDGLCAQLVRWLYTTDTPTNVCPSIHVFNSVTLALPTAAARSLPGQTGGGSGLHPTVCALPSAPPPCCSSSTAALTLPLAWRWLLLWTALPVPSGGAKHGRSVWPKRSAPAAGLHAFPIPEKNRPHPEPVQSTGSGAVLCLQQNSAKPLYPSSGRGRRSSAFRAGPSRIKIDLPAGRYPVWAPFPN